MYVICNNYYRKSVDSNKNQTKQSCKTCLPRYLWIRLAIFEKQLHKILDYLVQNYRWDYRVPGTELQVRLQNTWYRITGEITELQVNVQTTIYRITGENRVNWYSITGQILTIWFRIAGEVMVNWYSVTGQILTIWFRIAGEVMVNWYSVTGKITDCPGQNYRYRWDYDYLVQNYLV